MTIARHMTRAVLLDLAKQCDLAATKGDSDD
jgi:hypothetical protein